MGGKWKHRANATAHARAAKAAKENFTPGQPCCLCGHPMETGDRTELDHDDTGGYRGLAHASPCRTCGRRCNPSEGGRKRARDAGQKLRDRNCAVCGKPFRATTGTSGAAQATCGVQQCENELRRRRRQGEPDGDPPPLTGRPW